MIFSVAQRVIITDQEYIIAERYYELDACSQNIEKQTSDYRVPSGYYGADAAPIYVAPTEAEIEKCKAEKTAQLIASRKASFKMDVLN
ncbi:hypothetical protein KKG31_01840 [Patescibacteria group bacterium]|nr:hypothetical protein [Patescibacteria group bacterium]MBU1757914.1 hypothetical protein [Patescibacteria group bacterium]